jgi:uncharacterized protein with NRDE domain
VCLLVFSWQQHPRYRLILAGNRDEFHNRPTAPANWWEDESGVLAGKDLEAGGTWLGVSRRSRFGIVTNFRETATPSGGMRSRGELICDFLESTEDPGVWSADVETNGTAYGGFNLIVGDHRELRYLSNRGPEAKSLPAGLFGLSNKRLDTPWPKLLRAKKRFAGLIDDTSLDNESLFEMLADPTRSKDADLPDTGIPHEWEQLLSSVFIVSPAYGTRASTVLLIGHDGSVFFEERRFGADGESIGNSRFAFETVTG